MLIGLPSTSPGNLDSKIQDEHMRHLVAELDIKVIIVKNMHTKFLNKP